MQKYRIKTIPNSFHGTIAYVVQERFFLFFYIDLKSFSNKEDAKNYHNKLTEKII